MQRIRFKICLTVPKDKANKSADLPTDLSPLLAHLSLQHTVIDLQLPLGLAPAVPYTKPAQFLGFLVDGPIVFKFTAEFLILVLCQLSKIIQN